VPFTDTQTENRFSKTSTSRISVIAYQQHERMPVGEALPDALRCFFLVSSKVDSLQQDNSGFSANIHLVDFAAITASPTRGIRLVRITKFISTILGRLRGKRATRLNEIQSPEQFRTVIDRERSRADRRRSGFSLVVFTCPIDDGTAAGKNRQRFLSTIHNRIRCTDFAGWIGEDKLGMLIVDSSTKQVNQLVSALSKEFRPSLGPLDYQIESYPESPSTQIISVSAELDGRSPSSSETMPA